MIAYSPDTDVISKILTALKNKEPVAQKQKVMTGFRRPTPPLMDLLDVLIPSAPRAIK